MENRIKVLTNLFWRFGERIGAQLVSFVVTIVISRILDPEDYGIIAIVNVFISLADIFVASGFGSALIQKKDADEIDYSSVFYFQLVLSGFIYLIVFFSAPLIQKFYGSQYSLLTPVLRVLGLRLFLTALNSVQNAYVSKHLQFKKFFFATLIGTIISAVFGIVAAYQGLGTWALVIQYLTNSVIDTIILWITVEWHPIWKFSFSRLKKLYSFGWKLLLSAVIDTLYQSLRDLLIGKFYSASDLAFYNRGSSYPLLLIKNVNTSIDNVLFPVMSKSQDSIETVKQMARRSIKCCSYIIFPLMMGLAVVGKPMIRVMLTEKWLPAVPYLQIFCFAYSWSLIHTANINAIKSLGRSDLILKLELIRDILELIALGISIKFGVFWVAFSSVFLALFKSVIYSFPNNKLLNYSYFQQIKDLLPAAILAIVMGVPVYCINFTSLPDIVKLIIQVPLGGIIYIGLSWLFKVEAFNYLLNTGMDFLKGIKRRGANKEN